jgi:hypothetical protein
MSVLCCDMLIVHTKLEYVGKSYVQLTLFLNISLHTFIFNCLYCHRHFR